MRYFAVTRERGSAWDASRPMPEQARWPEHAAFMNGLVDEGFVVLGGPLGDGQKILLIVDAETEEAVHARLADDPWTDMQLLRVAKIVPWQILLGDQRAAALRSATTERNATESF
jgi:uncharacterized protein YciI